MHDPYLIPKKNILINKFGIQDAEKLQDLESAIYYYLKTTDQLPNGDFDYAHLKNIHHHLFGKLYDWAGQERTIDIIKGHSHFARKEFIENELNKVFMKLKEDKHLSELNHINFCKKLSFYFNEINAAHPFRDGNGRSLRTFFDLLSNKAGYKLEWEKIDAKEYIQANISGFNGDYDPIEKMFTKIATPVIRPQEIKIHQDRELFIQRKPHSTVLNNAEKELMINIIANSVPIPGTLAERYLKQHRGITDVVSEDTFRFHSSVFEPETQRNWPALIVIARNEKQEVRAIQCVYLHQETANKLEIKTPKRDYGPKKGASVLIQRGQGVTNQFAIAKDLETALIVAKSNKDLSVWTSLGIANLGSTPLPTGSNDILICVDNDGINADFNKALDKVVNSFSERGLNVWYAKSIDCTNFNNALKKQGSDEIKKILDAKKLIKKAMTIEELIENKNTLSKIGKIMTKFIQKSREHKSFSEPKSIKEIENKVALFKQVGRLALLIKNNIILKEAAERHKIDKEVSALVRDYIEHQKWLAETKTLIEKLGTKDPIDDYLKIFEQQKSIIAPWLSQSESEKEQWHVLNIKVNQLAFIIEKNPHLYYNAKKLNIDDNIKVRAAHYSQEIIEQLMLQQDRGRGR
jgi:cell filamentation protein